jgi:acyl carrier protein|tara:strand:+ start:450 stop:638 length:189 start_codon:yes stop_codon:yes gene_type:complete
MVAGNIEQEGTVLNVELVGIKNLKTTHNWRLEFDVYEIDSNKVAELVGQIEKAFVMALVENE